jgi:hypothetical protein
VDQIQLIPTAFECAPQFHSSKVIQLHGFEAMEFRDGGFRGLSGLGEGLFGGIGGALGPRLSLVRSVDYRKSSEFVKNAQN